MNHVRLAFFYPMLLAMLVGCGDSNAVREACKNNDDCAEGEFCASGTCPADFSSGECTERPDPAECEDEREFLVCGCDGVTYGNSCFARAEGVRVAIELPCSCEDESDCSDEQACVRDLTSDTGRCEFR
jgi:hypothetical protein